MYILEQQASLGIVMLFAHLAYSCYSQSITCCHQHYRRNMMEKLWDWGEGNSCFRSRNREMMNLEDIPNGLDEVECEKWEGSPSSAA